MLGKYDLGDFDFEGFLENAETLELDTTSPKEAGCERQIVLAIDASNSMRGYKIGSINDYVNNIISKLKTVSHTNGKQLSIAVVGFASKLFRWTNSFVPVAAFQYSYVEMVDGLSNINALLVELNNLTRNQMCQDAQKYVVLFSDGLMTEEYRTSLQEWRQAEQYSDIVKVVVGFDDDLHDEQSVEFFNDFVERGQVLSIKEPDKLLSILLE